MTSAVTGASRFTHSISPAATSAVDHWGGASVAPACGAAGVEGRGEPTGAGSCVAGWGAGPEIAAASARTLGAAARPDGVSACSETASGAPVRTELDRAPIQGETTESVTTLVMAATENAAEQQATIFPD